jgi:hypothetical protein
LEHEHLNVVLAPRRRSDARQVFGRGRPFGPQAGCIPSSAVPGKSNAKGMLPWNQGFTACRSVESTSTGDELASVSTCKSAISLKRWSLVERLKYEEANAPTTRMTAAAEAVSHPSRRPRCGLGALLCCSCFRNSAVGVKRFPAT